MTCSPVSVAFERTSTSTVFDDSEKLARAFRAYIPQATTPLVPQEVSFLTECFNTNRELVYAVQDLLLFSVNTKLMEFFIDAYRGVCERRVEITKNRVGESIILQLQERYPMKLLVLGNVKNAVDQMRLFASQKETGCKNLSIAFMRMWLDEVPSFGPTLNLLLTRVQGALSTVCLLNTVRKEEVSFPDAVEEKQIYLLNLSNHVSYISLEKREDCLFNVCFYDRSLIGDFWGNPGTNTIVVEESVAKAIVNRGAEEQSVRDFFGWMQGNLSSYKEGVEITHRAKRQSVGNCTSKSTLALLQATIGNKKDYYSFKKKFSAHLLKKLKQWSFEKCGLTEAQYVLLKCKLAWKAQKSSKDHPFDVWSFARNAQITKEQVRFLEEDTGFQGMVPLLQKLKLRGLDVSILKTHCN